MKYYEKLNYRLSRGFKNSIALDLLDFQLDKEPNDIFRLLPFREEGYDLSTQGNNIKYEFDENTGNIFVLLETFFDSKKQYISFQIKRSGNEIDIITRIPREDSCLLHIRHNANDTVTCLFKRIKFLGREDEQVLETRYALFNDDGTILEYNEQNLENQISSAIFQCA